MGVLKKLCLIFLFLICLCNTDVLYAKQAPKKKKDTSEIDSNYFAGSIEKAKQFLIGKWQGHIEYWSSDMRGTRKVRKDLTYKFNIDGSIIMKEVFYYPNDDVMPLPVSYEYWNVRQVNGDQILIYHSESDRDVNGVEWSNQYLYKEMVEGYPDATRFTAINKNEIKFGIMSDPQTKEWVNVGTLKRVFN